MSASQFADEIGVQRSSVSHVLSGRNKPSLDFITKIIDSYPEINADWLLTGKGEVLQFNEDISGNNVKEGHQTSIELDSDTEEVTEKTQEMAVEAKLRPKKAKTGNRESAAGSKTIDKIVFFYRDGSFSEYVPE
ncbi:MAG: helix-turn-helix transcriptional regulator [Bacteroidales bacterium]|nr:helix-turn-helix transcriptional regulator [Bacteroidales bacterium]